MEPEISQAWQLIGQGLYVHARKLVEQVRNPGVQRQALARIHEIQRQRLTDLWQAEHATGGYAPVQEVTLDLEELSFTELDDLAARIQARIDARDSDLPRGWHWSGEWRGQHDDGRVTSLYTERAAALREMRRQMTPLERTLGRELKRRPESTTDELFEEAA